MFKKTRSYHKYPIQVLRAPWPDRRSEGVFEYMGGPKYEILQLYYDLGLICDTTEKIPNWRNMFGATQIPSEGWEGHLEREKVIPI